MSGSGRVPAPPSTPFGMTARRGVQEAALKLPAAAATRLMFAKVGRDQQLEVSSSQLFELAHQAIAWASTSADCLGFDSSQLFELAHQAIAWAARRTSALV
eukprot:365479-Chlamydomonas_euryale.AAC.1